MATLLDFRRRIRSVKNTQQITRAMKFVAAARLRRAQEAALAARPYAKELTRVLRSTISRIAEPQHPLLARRPEERVLALVLTGERDIVTPPRHGRAVAERIPGATFELMTGVGASHGLLFERTDDFVRTVLTFLEQQSLA